MRRSVGIRWSVQCRFRDGAKRSARKDTAPSARTATDHAVDSPAARPAAPITVQVPATQPKRAWASQNERPEQGQRRDRRDHPGHVEQVGVLRVVAGGRGVWRALVDGVRHEDRPDDQGEGREHRVDGQGSAKSGPEGKAAHRSAPVTVMTATRALAPPPAATAEAATPHRRRPGAGSRQGRRSPPAPSGSGDGTTAPSQRAMRSGPSRSAGGSGGRRRHRSPASR